MIRNWHSKETEKAARFVSQYSGHSVHVRDHDQCIMMHLFIYLFVCGSYFLSLEGCCRGMVGYTCKTGCGVVLAYMCYSCSNTEVVSIHIHAFRKARCVHGSVLSPITLPSYSNRRQGYTITFA